MFSRLGQRLYLRIWLAVVAAVAVVTLLLGWILQAQVEHERAQRPGRDVVVRNDMGQVLGQAKVRPVRVPGQGLEFQVPLADGQTLVVQLPRPSRPSGRSEPFWLQPPFGLVWLLALVAVAVALAAYPIVRRLTQRIEAVQKGVERWGEGDLGARVPVQGQDEIAFLAQRFNTAAERVQTLVRSHKALLANASHELRSPLARIRMGLELMPQAKGPALDEVKRNIAELDTLVDEILLASRLDLADAPLGAQEEVDLTGLAAEECAHAGVLLVAPQAGGSAVVWGSARLLRRLLRNLLENARRHARHPDRAADVTVSVAVQGRWARLMVQDRGPGVPLELRERIFEPFFRLPGASERDGGVGLGLALVRTIAERHGGRAWCEDHAGGGARFGVELPLHRP